MTVFLVHDGDGKILQANKLFDAPTKQYVDQMEANEHSYIALNRETLVQPDAFYVHNKRLRRMQVMAARVSKKIIKAGGTDTVVITGAPAECEYRVDVNIPGVGTVTTHAGILSDGEIEMGMDVPCLFTIHLTKFPLKPFAVQIEASA